MSGGGRNSGGGRDRGSLSSRGEHRYYSFGRGGGSSGSEGLTWRKHDSSAGNVGKSSGGGDDGEMNCPLKMRGAGVQKEGGETAAKRIMFISAKGTEPGGDGDNNTMLVDVQIQEQKELADGMENIVTAVENQEKARRKRTESREERGRPRMVKRGKERSSGGRVESRRVAHRFQWEMLWVRGVVMT